MDEEAELEKVDRALQISRVLCSDTISACLAVGRAALESDEGQRTGPGRMCVEKVQLDKA